MYVNLPSSHITSSRVAILIAPALRVCMGVRGWMYVCVCAGVCSSVRAWGWACVCVCVFANAFFAQIPSTSGQGESTRGLLRLGRRHADGSRVLVMTVSPFRDKWRHHHHYHHHAHVSAARHFIIFFWPKFCRRGMAPRIRPSRLIQAPELAYRIRK